MNNSRRLIPATALVAAALALPALTACSGSSAAATGGDGKGGGKLRVTASFYPLEFLATRIGGSDVQVTDLTKPGVEPHDLELAPRQIAALQQADVIISLHGLQPAVDDAIGQSGVKNTVDAAALTRLEDHGTEVDGRRHTTGDNGTGGGSEEDAGSDPHIWLDPVRYAEVAKGVGKALAQADPAHSAAYAKNTDTLVARLGALDTEFRDGLKNRATDTFITTHAAFGYLAERYGLVEEAINGIDPESEPSAGRMKALLDLAGREHVTTVFFETLVSDKTARTVAGDLRLRTDVLDPIEGITPMSRGTDYFAVQRANLQALKTALGVPR
ncbi:metal ABC transporter substrate-binding protein [Streptomyces sp. NBC_01477]|uniref:metal ABC transporter substrate-binding protein n=1 Tax=Streptomyces sp. NBC_01477 TaxID=2976015 RepID=UPI002E34F220|nr:metal ABC transporter substrate-binding protein [Streptomyces sp. NBC_01477]